MAQYSGLRGLAAKGFWTPKILGQYLAGSAIAGVGEQAVFTSAGVGLLSGGSALAAGGSLLPNSSSKEGEKRAKIAWKARVEILSRIQNKALRERYEQYLDAGVLSLGNVMELEGIDYTPEEGYKFRAGPLYGTEADRILSYPFPSMNPDPERPVTSP